MRHAHVLLDENEDHLPRTPEVQAELHHGARIDDAGHTLDLLHIHARRLGTTEMVCIGDGLLHTHLTRKNADPEILSTAIGPVMTIV